MSDTDETANQQRGLRMTIQSNIFDDAKRAFETLPSSGTLVRAVGILVRGGASEGEARGWAGNIVRDYGLPMDRHGEFDRIVARGLRLGAPPEAPESEKSEPVELQINVRPSLDQFALPIVADLSAEQLLAVASDPAGTKQRLRELQKNMAAVAEAAASFSDARAEFDGLVERTQAELAERAAIICKREVAVFVAEEQFKETRERVAEQSRTLNARLKRFEQLPGGGVRDHGDPDDRDVEKLVFTPPSYTEPVPGSHTGMTHTVHPESRSPRRRGLRRV